MLIRSNGESIRLKLCVSHEDDGIFHIFNQIKALMVPYYHFKCKKIIDFVVTLLILKTLFPGFWLEPSPKNMAIVKNIKIKRKLKFYKKM